MTAETTMKRRTFLRLGAGTAVSGVLSACGSNHDDHSDPPPAGVPVTTAPQYKTVIGWTDTALQAVRTALAGPPMAARSLAVMYSCMYNAWCAYDDTAVATRTGRVAKRPAAERTPANKAAAMSHAAYAALVDQFPSQKAAFDAYMRNLGHDPAAGAGGQGTPAGIGAGLARAEIDFCHTDGANQLGDLGPTGVAYADYTGYAAKNPPLVINTPTMPEQVPEPSFWQPLTYPDATGALRTPVFLGAAWERVRPFALASASQFRPGPPARFGTQEYLDQVRRIVDVQAALTDEQKVMAEYWNDGPGSDLPPGHWLRIGQFVSQRDSHTDDDDIRMFLALSMALADAAIAAWDAKRTYDSERPITAVRYVLCDEIIKAYGAPGPAAGLRMIKANIWVPYQAATFPTPPFPEHVSGHSAFSAAAAEVLKQFTRSDAYGDSIIKPAHEMRIEPGMPTHDVALGWPTFTAAAEEAGISRVYGGIHFDNANSGGQMLGRRVGAQAFAAAQALWQGRA
jgi:hypothetical protein